MARSKQKPAGTRFRTAHAIEQWPVERLRPYERNSRTHSDEQVAKLARSIERFGFTSPVLASEDGVILAGHGRVMAAQKLGLTEVPVIIAGGWTDEERRAYVIADNQLALEAGWDEDLLRIELGELRDAGFDLSLTGFDAAGLAGILDVRLDGATDPEAAPDAPANPVATHGDLWALGRHRLLCGDATSAEDSARLLDGAKPHLMVTDPPYGVSYDPSWRPNSKSRRADGSKFSSGHHALGKVTNDDRADWREAWALFPGDVAYVWCASLHSDAVIISLEAAGLLRRSQLIWAKPVHVIGRGDYHWQHEPCWYAVRKGKTGHWSGDRKQTTIWTIANMHRTQGEVDDGKTSHGTQKPIECMKRPIENNSQPGDAIYEPFSGSGTTLIAAEMTGRKCYAIEIDPAYIDVAISRWQDFTKEAATLVDSGKTFEQVKRQRRKAA